VSWRAAHRLIEPYIGKCNNVHGEYYTAIITIESETLDKCGMIVDFGEAKSKIKAFIDEKWDHSYMHASADPLGDLLMSNNMKTYNFSSNPTAENIAHFLFDFVRFYIGLNCTSVGIVESTADSIAYYHPEKK
jgi:6-pyruvoyl tetrahydropterin synthase/QueD family protein